MEKVSVIIPIYNVEEYLAQCLESIINQTYRNLEIICINDCSTDNSLTILKEYQQKDSRIVILQNKENGGLAYTRNVGIQKAAGEYVLFVDSDDMIVGDLVESCLKVASDSDMVCFSVWSKLFRRQFLVDNHISFYDGILYEDMLFSFQCFVKARKIYSLNRQLYVYRVRDTSIMTTGITGRNMESYIISICELMKLYLQGSFSQEMNRAVEGYIRKVSREYISVYRKWGNRELEPALLKDKPEYMKLYRTFSELFVMPGKLLSISPEQAEKIRQYQYVILYGAGDIARSTIERLDQLDIPIYGIAVSNVDGNKKSLLGNPIRELQDYHEVREKCLILIGTIPRYYREIREQLQEKGFREWMEMIQV